MRVHYLQHVPFEALGSMESVFIKKGHNLTCTKFYDQEALPSMQDIDWLIVMGGPMGVHDEQIYPWLEREKKFIEEAILSGKVVLGICLGAQLIAHVLGAKVYKNKHSEIGWFDIVRSKEVETSIFAKAIPSKAKVFHWHGDTFDIPNGAIPMAKSVACPNQGFILEDRVFAFQFHLETTLLSAEKLIDNCGSELDGSMYVQSKNEILLNPERFTKINRIMFSVLEAIERTNQ
ncbi:MAG: type 1 glutamine amidotransferase [Desulfobacteraceae bacterium]|nr:type 1 glutamine amidotransferase [Desulfobacteraceae bacterium]